MKQSVRFVLALVLCCLFAVGCSSGVRPDKVARQYVDAWIASDYDTVAKLMGEVNPIPPSSSWEYELMRSSLARDTYQVGNTTVNGENAEVSLTVKALDWVHIASKLASDTLSMKLATPSLDTNAYSRQYLTNAANDPDSAMVTLDVTLTLHKKDGSWIVEDPKGTNFENAVTGGMTSAFGL